ncbi:S-adenosyl-L-methionine-dependent methyltransferase [Auriculariales sp. MPI-PUGE-AT-0066]|nr:S-adenosyl-L-methionine-dependent methyltransferase [Auriculariales sp. MPI-PUGE-AT-0066]
MLALRAAAHLPLRYAARSITMSTAGLVHSRDASPIPGPATKRPRLESPNIVDMDVVIEPSTVAQTLADEIPADLQQSAAPEKRPQGAKKGGAKKFKRPPPPEPGSADDVSWFDVVALLGKDAVDAAVAANSDYTAPVKFGDEFELTVDVLSSNGEALARLPASHPPWVVKIPFCLPGERVRVKVIKNARLASSADLLEVLEANNELRDDSRVKCQYFGKCAGCQYQMLSYEKQLETKATVVGKAYENYSSKRYSPQMSRPCCPTMPSPLQYNYRTKITPHFDAPPANRTNRGGRQRQKKDRDSDWQLAIGFEVKGRGQILDIEECPIATQTLNDALTPARTMVQSEIQNYKKSATLLLRDSLEAFSEDPTTQPEKHICISDHKAVVRERVGSHIFEFPAGSFFQNNNAILPSLTAYVRDAIFTPGLLEDATPTHLVDAYCGSGLFSITLANAFETVVGVEIDEKSIKAARANALLNGLPESRCAFTAGTASAIFESVGAFPPARTAVVIDPPRKGCDEQFLGQLLAFRPATLVYVSCNVHTQARDVGVLVNRTRDDGEGRRYQMESLRGFDLFPQTAHVESVAVLRLM